MASQNNFLACDPNWRCSLPHTLHGRRLRKSTHQIGFVQMEVALRRFYFHLSAGTEIALDEEGTELPDLSAAKGEVY
jgi:hypothetical protein